MSFISFITCPQLRSEFLTERGRVSQHTWLMHLIVVFCVFPFWFYRVGGKIKHFDVTCV